MLREVRRRGADRWRVPEREVFFPAELHAGFRLDPRALFLVPGDDLFRVHRSGKYTTGMHPGDPVEKHFTRLKPDQKKALGRLGIRTIGDLLYHFPARYEAAGPTGTIAGAAAGTEVTLYGTIRKPDVRKTWKSRRPIAEAFLEDASGKIKMMWFSQPYIAKTLADGMVVKATGRVGESGTKVYLANPEIDRT